MGQNGNESNKKYDLEERTFIFAKRVIAYVNALPKTIANIEIGKQLIRSAGSIGANYLEANNSLGKKDFLMRIRISKKEARESCFWIRLNEPIQAQNGEKEWLFNEAEEFTKILGSILKKSRIE